MLRLFSYLMEGGADDKLDSERNAKHTMYTKQEEEVALKEFERTGSISATIQKLGYPSKSTLYRWYEHRQAGLTNWHGAMGQFERKSSQSHCFHTEEHTRNASAEVKLNAIYRCFELGEDVEYVSRDIGYSRVSIYKWRRLYLESGGVGLMSSKKQIPRGTTITDQVAAPPTPEATSELLKQVNKLQLEVDILKETINILKKTQAPTRQI